jgi:hypothetical protein
MNWVGVDPRAALVYSQVSASGAGSVWMPLTIALFKGAPDFLRFERVLVVNPE